MNKLLLTVCITISIALGLLCVMVMNGRPASIGAAVKYRCPMHPDYIVDKAGNCPVCGMLLVPLRPVMPADTALATTRRSPELIEVPLEQQRMMGMRLAEAKAMLLEKTIRTVGHVSMPAPTRAPSTFAGVIDKVYPVLGSTGPVRLRPGEPILSVSSPELTAAQEQFLLAARSDGVLAAARRKLLDLGMDEDQIQTLERTRRPLNSLLLRAPKPLALVFLPQPGQVLRKGSDLYIYTDLSKLSLLVDISSIDIPLIKTGIAAVVRFPSHPGQVWHGRLTHNSEQFDERTQTLRTTVEFANDDTAIWQGMLAVVELHCSSRRALAIPDSAVVADGAGTTVFVARPGELFESRPVELGLRTDSVVEVRRGLARGDRVVASATFLLDSEFRLRNMQQRIAEAH